MPLAKMVALHEVPESDCRRVAAPQFAVVIARNAGAAVLVFNLYRKVWELPGGFIDPGESAREAAQRELLEEAECQGRDFHWLGLVEISDGTTYFGAVFACEVDEVPATVRNEEVSGIAHWRPGTTLQPLGATDAALLDRFA